jgi:predicted RND superfamily exporter protein
MFRFYRSNARSLLWLMALSFPFLLAASRGTPANNDVEAWLPKDTPARHAYDDFKREFGLEEVILIGVDPHTTDERLQEALAGRLEGLPGVGEVLTPERLVAKMGRLGVAPELARERLKGLLLGESDQRSAILVTLEQGTKVDRTETVRAIEATLGYSLLDGNDTCLAGGPVLIAELNRLGSPKASFLFFLLTLGVCLVLLQYSLRDWKMSLSLLGVTVWTIVCSQALIRLIGGEMNFIMGALPVMIMIFTLSISLHYLGYYSTSKDAGDPDAIRSALRESWRPCALSTLTTLLGLVSLNVSSILPVKQFGFASALGAVVAMVVGLGVTPALVCLRPDFNIRGTNAWFDFARWGAWVGRRRIALLTAGLAVTLLAGWGLTRLHPDIDPKEFLPPDNRVARDLIRIDNELTSIGSIEAVVDFGLSTAPFMERLQKVQEIQRQIETHASVRHTLSVATFFPDQFPDSPLEIAKILGNAQKMAGVNSFIAQEHRLWRISIRMTPQSNANSISRDLQATLAGQPIIWTGMSPLIADAQSEIFKGYWQSFTSALLSITLVMIIALRSITRALIAMVPNVLPVWLVFGAVGFAGLPIDIGMMMTGSIALGISVDCTFHFLVKYQEGCKLGHTSQQACEEALVHTGKPLMESTVVSSLGMLALCLSSFTPTSRFGWLMASQMVASLLGELVLLPALLGLRKSGIPRATTHAHPVTGILAESTVPVATELTSNNSGVVPLHAVQQYRAEESQKTPPPPRTITCRPRRMRVGG